MSLNPTDLKKLKDAFNTWASNHPKPNEPAIASSSGEISPRQFARDIQNETPAGKQYLEIFAYAINNKLATVDEIVADFTEPSPKPPTP
jgi:hypothetical protein